MKYGERRTETVRNRILLIEQRLTEQVQPDRSRSERLCSGSRYPDDTERQRCAFA